MPEGNVRYFKSKKINQFKPKFNLETGFKKYKLVQKFLERYLIG